MRVYKNSFLAAAVAAMSLTMSASTAKAELIYATTITGQLVSWDSATPGTIVSGVAIGGLQPNEQIAAIDIRPATGELYALGTFSHVYVINPANGGATLISPNPGFTPALNGSAFGFDFNPTVDRIRETSEANQNQRLHPVTGLVAATDTNLAYAAGDPHAGFDPDVANVAYTNNFNGATTTTLYGIDSDRDVLVTINPPNNGTLNTVGSGLGVNVNAYGGFDISGVTGLAYAALQPNASSASSFYTVNLATGALTLVGQVNGGLFITSMTVAQVPEPVSATALASSLAMLGLRRRREAL